MIKPRLWFVLLLALLLPIRTVLAAATPCPHAGEATRMALQAHAQCEVDAAGVDEASASAMDTQMASSMAMDGHAMPDPDHRDHHGLADGCNACEACCVAFALPTHLSVVVASTARADRPFPDAAGPAASFLVEAQERPPRST